MNIKYSVNEEVTVKNVNGSGSKSPKCPNCGNWIDHWKNISGEKGETCSIVGCTEKVTDIQRMHGAHTLRPYAKNDDYKNHQYIIPMCPSHNGKRNEEMKVKANITFVRANVAESCGKKDK